MSKWNARIAAAAIDALNNPKIYGVNLSPMYCLNFTRRVIEEAVDLVPGGFYRLVLGVDGSPTAAELEKLMRRQRKIWLIERKNAVSGDTFWWKDLPRPWGHVGIFVRGDFVLNKSKREVWTPNEKGTGWIAQNTTDNVHGVNYPGALRLIKASEMPTPTSVIRIGG